MKTGLQQQSSFLFGLCSPSIWFAPGDPPPNRVGLSECDNFYVKSDGSLQRRPGTNYVARTKNDAKARLIPFIYNRDQVFVVELGHLYARFYALSGQLGSGGTPQEIATGYTGAHLDDLSFAYSRDALIIVHELFTPRAITRNASGIFAIADLAFTSKPSDWAGSSNPRRVAFVAGRLVMASTPNKPTSVWLSKSGDHLNFTKGTAADDAMEITLQGKEANDITAIVEEHGTLVIASAGQIKRLRGTGTDGIIKPDNFELRGEVTPGANAVQPIVINGAIVHGSSDGRGLREMAYQFDRDRDSSIDLNVRFRLSQKIKNIAIMHEPSSIIWLHDDKGGLYALSYRRQEGLIAWSKHVLGGEGVVESLCVTPGLNGDRLWLAVKRVIGSTVFRTIETMELSSAHFSDCALSYDGASTSTLSGLAHMEGAQVGGVLDGVNINTPLTVSSGTVTLPKATLKATIGYKFVAMAGMLPPVDIQTPRARPARVVNTRLSIDAPDTLSLEASGDGTNWYGLSCERFGTGTYDQSSEPSLQDLCLTGNLYKIPGQTLKIRANHALNASIRVATREYGLI